MMPREDIGSGARPACPLATDQIDDILTRDFSSARKSQARIGDRYYNGDNDIMRHRIFYFDGDGELVEDVYASNIKIPHAFFAELVDQKIDYLINPWERHVTSDDAALDELLAPYFDHRFNANLAEACRDASKGGFGYLYAYTSDDGSSRFDCAECMGVAEARFSSVTADCDYVLYRYVDHIDYGSTEVVRVQVWDDTWTWFFVKSDNGGYEIDSSMPDNPKPHRQWTDERGGEWYSGFGAIPFWRIDNNSRQVSDLAPIKAIIDDYDLMKCGLSNNLEDLTEGFVVVRNYAGDGGLDEMITNLKKKKHVGVDEQGDVDIRTVNIPYEARKTNMDIDRENIYHFGMGLNTAGLADTTATTNMAIKAAYALLDLKCNKFEMQLRKTLDRMVEFVVDEINRHNGTGYTADDVSIEFSREVMTNAQDNAQTALIEAQEQQTKMATLLNAASVYGDDAVLESVCAILDLDPEKVRETLPEKEYGGLGEAVAALTGDE